ncbi:MAG: hypothetical protein OEL53_17765 [Rhodospirillales bacterium]|nr:hypothetical protein [Rhodospirillales bacterium]
MSASRSPAWPRPAFWFWLCSERTRTSRPDGLRSKWSPTWTCPEKAVPVTTTPAPEIVKARSMDRRKRPATRSLPAPADKRAMT